MPQDIRNYPLYTYIDAWIGTPYKPQSLDKKTGVDASYFVQALFSYDFNDSYFQLRYVAAGRLKQEQKK